jgi:2-haloacid dehalogenase
MSDRWATFDCYGTLIDWEGGIRDAAAELWPNADPERMLALHHVVEPRVEDNGGVSYREVLTRVQRAVAAIEGLEIPAGRESALADSLPSWRPFEEVPGSLGELRERGWKLCILSNTDPDYLEASLAQIPVEFDLTITASEIGSYKPGLRHWEEFNRRSGVEEGCHVHVAASLFHDIEPCTRLGLPSVWINRLGEASSLARAAELSDLKGLAERLEEICPED